MEVTCVTVDSADPAALVRFWSAALGWPEVRISADGSSAECHPPGDGPYLELYRVAEAKVAKNRVHLGCHAGELAALDGEIARLVALGATLAWEEEFPPAVAAVFRNVVLRDPEGNEFCLGAGEWPG